MDQFESAQTFQKTWIPSRSQKEDVPEDKSDSTDKELWQYKGKWELEEPSVAENGCNPGDMGLVLKSAAAHHAISRKFEKPVEFKGKDTVAIQYEVRLQNGLECGGAYMKLLSYDEKFQPSKFSDKTPYSIMFGPDKCGATNKVHFIFRHKSKKSGQIVEHHLKNPPTPPNTFSKQSHVYTLIVHPEKNTYEIKIDGESKQKGSLLEDFEPPVVPPKQIDDPNDMKPADWVDEAKIPDPAAKKPEDWDEDAPLEIEDASAKMPAGWLTEAPEYVPDPDAKKPEDWDDEEDGEWIPPTVPNPKCATAPGCGPWKRPMKKNPNYKGKWYAPLIDNPKYKGVWAPKKIDNPDYIDEKHPGHITPIGAVGFELWTMQSNILFDNILVSNGMTPKQVDEWTKLSWEPKSKIEKELAKLKDEEVDVASEIEGKDLTLLEQFDSENLKVFAADLIKDPLKAAKQFPAVAGVAASGLLTLLLTLFFSFRSSPPQKKAAPVKASASPKKTGSPKKTANGTSTATAATVTEATKRRQQAAVSDEDEAVSQDADVQGSGDESQ